MASVAAPQAVVAKVPGVSQQVLLVAGLRWRMYRNSLRTFGGKLDVLANVLIAGATGSVALVVGAGLGALAFTLALRGRFSNLGILFWGIFLAWQFLPILMATFNQEPDSRNLLRFPVRFPAYFALSLAYGVFDPVAVVTMVWFVFVGIGILLARPQLFPIVITALLLLALTSLLLNRVLFSWLEKLLARRRTRETVVALLLMSLVAVQLAGPLLESHGQKIKPYLKNLVPIMRILPPGLASAGVEDAADFGTRSPRVFSALLLLTVYPCGMGFLLAHRLRQQYRGEDLGEAPATTAAVSASSIAEEARRGWTIPGVSAPAAAMFEKEVRYLLRSGMRLMEAFLPVLLVTFFGLLWTQPETNAGPEFLKRAPDLLFPSAVAYVALLLGQSAYNSFAFDGWGVQLLFAAPVRFRDVLLGKNLASAALIGIEALLTLAVLALIGRRVSPMVAVITLLALAMVMLIHFAIGNVMSICFPRAVDFARMKQRARGTTVVLYMVTQVVVLAIAGAVVGIAVAARQMALAIAIFVVLDLGALKVYQVMLERCNEFAQSRREKLISELCK